MRSIPFEGFDVLSQRSIENLESVTIYPASEMVLDAGTLKDGMNRIEKEADKVIASLREQFKTEEATPVTDTDERIKGAGDGIRSRLRSGKLCKLFL